MDSPAKLMAPALKGRAPLIKLNMVLLPAPLGPMSPRISPERNSNERSLTATRPPNCLRALSTISKGPVMSRRARFANAGAGGTGGAACRGSSRASHGHTPSRVRCSNRTISMPKTTTSKLPARPSKRGRMSCNSCFSKVMRVAPTTAPQTLPAPPTTAMKRYSMPWLMPNGVGLTNR